MGSLRKGLQGHQLHASTCRGFLNCLLFGSFIQYLDTKVPTSQFLPSSNCKPPGSSWNQNPMRAVPKNWTPTSWVAMMVVTMLW